MFALLKSWFFRLPIRGRDELAEWYLDRSMYGLAENDNSGRDVAYEAYRFADDVLEQRRKTQRLLAPEPEPEPIDFKAIAVEVLDLCNLSTKQQSLVDSVAALLQSRILFDA